MGILDTPFRLEELCQSDDKYATETSQMQLDVEIDMLRIFNKHIKAHGKNGAGWVNPSDDTRLIHSISLDRLKHIEYLQTGLNFLPSRVVALDASRAWLCFWILNTLDLFDCSLTNDVKERAIATLSRMQNATGGFGGGPGQMSHIAPTYAAVNALAIIGTKEAFDIINREKLYTWLLSLKLPKGNFLMHKGGEADIRACYCLLSVATLTNILTPELSKGIAEWIAECQTYEGGFAGSPGNEAHGGYTFCGLAAMEMLGKSSMLDLKALTRFCVQRQQQLEGGFSGRTNKLVDGCYSFWVGAVFPLLEAIQMRNGEQVSDMLFDRTALQEYILLCCQSGKGGLRDKPGKNADYYHTNYVASGLSLAQHHIVWDQIRAEELSAKGKDPQAIPYTCLLWSEEIGSRGMLVIGQNAPISRRNSRINPMEALAPGTVPPPDDEWEDVPHEGNLVAPLHPIYNLVLGRAEHCIRHFYGEQVAGLV